MAGMGQIGPLLTFSGTNTTKECYSADFIAGPGNSKRRFLRHIDIGNPMLGNGIIAAGDKRIGGRRELSNER